MKLPTPFPEDPVLICMPQEEISSELARAIFIKWYIKNKDTQKISKIPSTAPGPALYQAIAEEYPCQRKQP